MTTKKKGMGAYENTNVTLPQRIKLIDWLRERKGDRRPYDDLAEEATRELGFEVTGHCLRYTWVALHGRRNNARTADHEDIVARVQVLERGLDRAWKAIDALRASV